MTDLQRAQVELEIAILMPRDRELVRLMVIEGVTDREELAARLGLSRVTIPSMRYRIRSSLPVHTLTYRLLPRFKRGSVKAPGTLMPNEVPERLRQDILRASGGGCLRSSCDNIECRLHLGTDQPEPCAAQLAYDRGSMTLDEIGEVFGLTRERIRQIETTALVRFRQNAAQLGFDVDLAALTRVSDARSRRGNEWDEAA